jgi:retinol dehydrogenase-12
VASALSPPDGAAGRTFLVTGANTGIGLATVRELARRGGRVVLACRDAGRARAAIARIRAELPGAADGDRLRPLGCDLADLASVHRAVGEFRRLGEPLHGLVNNAGVAGRRGSTADGFELAFGVNHLGHFALTIGLLDLLEAAAPARVVTVASDSHFQAKGIDFAAVRRPTASLLGLREYAASKLANVLFTQELARRTAGTGVTSAALHPGVVASDIWRRVPWPVRPLLTRRMLSVEEGAATSVYCATAPELAATSGRYYERCREREPSRVATPDLGRELWERSLAWSRG